MGGQVRQKSCDETVNPHPVELFDISVCRELEDFHGDRRGPVQRSSVNLQGHSVR